MLVEKIKNIIVSLRQIPVFFGSHSPSQRWVFVTSGDRQHNDFVTVSVTAQSAFICHRPTNPTEHFYTTGMVQKWLIVSLPTAKLAALAVINHVVQMAVTRWRLRYRNCSIFREKAICILFSVLWCSHILIYSPFIHLANVRMENIYLLKKWWNKQHKRKKKADQDWVDQS